MEKDPFDTMLAILSAFLIAGLLYFASGFFINLIRVLTWAGV